MITPSRFFLAALIALSSFTPSFATLWTGTITQTVTETQNPLISVGDTYVGHYSYESDTVDGTFPLDSGNARYSANWFVPQAYDGGLFNGFSSSYKANLKVSGGVVTSFYDTGEEGLYAWDIGTDEFGSVYHVFENAHLVFRRTSGTVSFSIPVAVAESAMSTAILLSAALTVLGLARLKIRSLKDTN